MAEHIEIHFPQDQQEGTEATVASWLVNEGDTVAAHDPVVEIETDKVVVEIAAPEAGRITKIYIQQDEAVNPGDVLCTLGAVDETGGAVSDQTESEPESAEAETETSSRSTPTGLSPAVRQRVQRQLASW